MNRNLVIFVIALLLTSCASGGDAAADPDDPAGPDTEASGEAEQGDDEEGEVDAGESSASPIMDYLGVEAFDPSDPQAGIEQFQASERARQELIAACMREQGFEYVPVDMSQAISFGVGDGEFGSDEWMATYGFGVSTLAFSQTQVGPDLVGFDDSAMADAEFDDPNSEAVAAMSDAERAAYNEALYGSEDLAAFPADATGEEMEAAAEAAIFEPQGCEGEAFAANEDPTMRFYQEFDAELTEMYERMQNDPQVVEVEQEIADCVADEGLEFSSTDDVYLAFEEAVAAIRDELVYPGDELTLEEINALSQEELDEIFGREPELSDAQRAELADIQEREVALAVAVNDCGGGFDDQTELFEELQAEYEQQFLEEHQDELADFSAE